MSLSWSAPGAAAACGRPRSPGLSSDPEKLLSTFDVCGEEDKWHLLDLELHRRCLGVKMQSVYCEIV